MIPFSILTFFFMKNTRLECLFIFCFATLLKYMYQPFENTGNFVSVCLYVDEISNILVLLSCWISALMVLSSSGKDNGLEMNIILILLVLCMFFYSSKTIMFFLFFEGSVIPTLFLILNWGLQPERLKAVVFFCIYTMIFSVPFLLCMMHVESELFVSFILTKKLGDIWTFFLLIVLLIKLPLFFLHFWLPKAHVEAPVCGSMILAGVLLKMGGYGVLRASNFFFFKTKTVDMFLAVSIVGSVMIAAVCLSCYDMKQLIAYSSVSHMNFMFYSMMEGSKLSMSASMMLMTVHGISSSGLFYISDLIYKRTNSRSIFLSKGVMSFYPLGALWLFLNIMTSTSVPPSLGSLSEVMIISSMFFKFLVSPMLSIMYVFLSLFYMIFFYYSIFHGSMKKKMLFNPFTLKESMTVLFHVAISWGLILLSELFTI